MEFKQLQTKEELEYEFFQELDLGDEKIPYEEEKKIIMGMDEDGDDIATIIKIIDDKAICLLYNSTYNYLVIDGLPETLLKVGGELWHRDNSRGDDVIPINKEIYDLKFLQKIETGLDGREISFRMAEEINKEYILLQVKDAMKQKSAKDEEERKKREARKKEAEAEEEKTRLEKEGFEKNNLVLQNITILGKEVYLKDGNGEKFVLSDDVNKILTFDFVSQLNYRNWNQRDELKDFLVKEEKSFAYENPQKNIKFEVTFAGEMGTWINNKKVSKNKMNFLLQKLMGGVITTDEEIEMLNKLSGMKWELLNLKEIDFRNDEERYKLDISFKMLKDDTFEIEFIDFKKVMQWDKLKDLFFRGRSTDAYMDLKELMEVAALMGLAKQDVYDYLKSVVIMANLKEKDED
jgi:hypothetical protein